MSLVVESSIIRYPIQYLKDVRAKTSIPRARTRITTRSEVESNLVNLDGSQELDLLNVTYWVLFR